MFIFMKETSKLPLFTRREKERTREHSDRKTTNHKK